MSHFRGVRIHYARSNALDVCVEMGGKCYYVKDVGIGHPSHTITDNRGRVSTDAEVALAEALALLSVEDE